MAITAYVGSPGSGKSYSVVTHVLVPAISSGRSVVTNIPLNILEFPASQHGLINLFDLDKFKNDKNYFDLVIIPGAIICIDECWKWLPSGLQSNKIEEHFKQFLAEHRHMVDADGRSTDICLVTQDLSQMASFPRQLVEKTYRTTKLLALGSRSKFRVDIYEGAVTGQSPPKSKLLSKSHLQSYKPENYKFYKSHTKSESLQAGALEVSADSRGSIFSSFVFKIGFPVAIIVLIAGIYGLSNFFKPKSKAIESNSVENTNIAKTPTINKSAVQAAAPIIKNSENWRIVGFTGYAQKNKHFALTSYALIQNGNSKPLRLPFKNCKFLIDKENRSIQCIYDDEKITWYTGQTDKTEYKIAEIDKAVIPGIN